MSFLLWFVISPLSSTNFPYIYIYANLFLGFLLLFHLAFCASTVLIIIAYNKSGLLVGRVWQSCSSYLPYCSRIDTSLLNAWVYQVSWKVLLIRIAWSFTLMNWPIMILSFPMYGNGWLFHQSEAICVFQCFLKRFFM